MSKQRFLKALKNAFNGMKYFFLHERNGKIQFTVSVIVIALAVGLRISNNEWLVVLLCIGVVISLEMLNTAIENLCNMVQEEYHPTIKIIKDVAAAAVLWISFISVVIACIIFLPKIISLI
jgi:diacylglycerol kinase